MMEYRTEDKTYDLTEASDEAKRIYSLLLNVEAQHRKLIDDVAILRASAYTLNLNLGEHLKDSLLISDTKLTTKEDK